MRSQSVPPVPRALREVAAQRLRGALQHFRDWSPRSCSATRCRAARAGRRAGASRHRARAIGAARALPAAPARRAGLLGRGRRRRRRAQGAARRRRSARGRPRGLQASNPPWARGRAARLGGRRGERGVARRRMSADSVGRLERRRPALRITAFAVGDRTAARCVACYASRTAGDAPLRRAALPRDPALSGDAGVAKLQPRGRRRPDQPLERRRRPHPRQRHAGGVRDDAARRVRCVAHRGRARRDLRRAHPGRDGGRRSARLRARASSATSCALRPRRRDDRDRASPHDATPRLPAGLGRGSRRQRGATRSLATRRSRWRDAARRRADRVACGGGAGRAEHGVHRSPGSS